MKAIGRGWNAFWFEPQSTATLAVFRIVFAAVVLVWALTLAPDVRSFFASDGLLPQFPGRPWSTGPMAVFRTDVGVFAVYATLLAASTALLVGYRTRLASVLTFAALLLLTRRNPWVTNAGETLLRALAFYLMLAPSGVALSLDARRRGQDLWTFPRRAPWALRLIQIQIAILYIATVWAKFGSRAWLDGSAVGTVFHIADYIRFPVPPAISESEAVIKVLTWGTLAVEAALGVLVWDRVLRPWVLLAGVGLHLGIDYTMVIGFFSIAVLTGYVAFISPSRMERWLLALRDRLRRHRRPAAGPAVPDPAVGPGGAG